MNDDHMPDPHNDKPRIVWQVIRLDDIPQSDNPFNLDADAVNRMLSYLEAFLSQDDDLVFNSSSVQDELAVLEHLDAQVTGDHHPQALAWIQNAKA
jgi:hypothetical protein